jgi:hypothetical protein
MFTEYNKDIFKEEKQWLVENIRLRAICNVRSGCHEVRGSFYTKDASWFKLKETRKVSFNQGRFVCAVLNMMERK